MKLSSTNQMKKNGKKKSSHYRTKKGQNLTGDETETLKMK